MNARSQAGEINALLIPLILVTLLLFGAGGFGVWAYGSRQDYKEHTDQKVAAAQELTKQQVSTAKDKEFAEKEKSPYKKYQGPQSLGSLSVTYPKTWSGYVISNSSSDPLLDAYFQPDVVPGVNNQSSQSYALRVRIVQGSYSDTLSQVTSSGSSDNPVQVKPYALPKVPGTVGVEVAGAIDNNKSGLMVILPLRNNTLEIWTEGSQHINDFNNIILKNFTFSP